MNKKTAFPETLKNRFLEWQNSIYQPQADAYQSLGIGGQKPEVMLITCCDSRVHATDIFKVPPGDFFTHRNISNIVPPHGEPIELISAVLEYGVLAMSLKHVVVLGHSNCGGVELCYDIYTDTPPPEGIIYPSIRGWVEHIRPAFDRIDRKQPRADQLAEMERQNVIESLDNLLTYPFIKDCVQAGELQLHGAWYDISNGQLLTLDPDTQDFLPVK